MNTVTWLTELIENTLHLFPDGAYQLFIVLYYLWFTITLVGVFTACISIIKKVFVFR